MKNSNMFTSILQSILAPEEIQTVTEEAGYEDKARKFTVTCLLQYWCVSALEQWDSYRSGVDFAASSGLPVVHYSQFSTRAAEVPFAIFKEFFHRAFTNVAEKHAGNLRFPKNCFSSIRPP